MPWCSIFVCLFVCFFKKKASCPLGWRTAHCKAACNVYPVHVGHMKLNSVQCISSFHSAVECVAFLSQCAPLEENAAQIHDVIFIPCAKEEKYSNLHHVKHVILIYDNCFWTRTVKKHPTSNWMMLSLRQSEQNPQPGQIRSVSWETKSVDMTSVHREHGKHGVDSGV